ncbi:MAG: hypothetical protein U9N60_03555 [Thermodesulfobacteriota bacterium]|nr:hypothetical protein [Thermodesulfobacteriota bacterium]
MATFSLNPNTESYPEGYRVYKLDINGNYIFIGSVDFVENCKLENNIVTFDLDLSVPYSGCYSLTAYNDAQESSFSNEYRLEVPPDSAEVPPDSAEVPPDSAEVSPDSAEVSPDSDGVSTDATVEYSVQVTLDPKLYPSIPNPVGYEVFYDTVSRWDGDYKFSKEVGIANCLLDGKFVTCDLKIEFEPGVTYFLSVKAFDNPNESAFSNEMSFTLPKDAGVSTDSDGDSPDSDGVPPDSDEDSNDSDEDSNDSDEDSNDSAEDSPDSDGVSPDSDEDSNDSDGDGIPDDSEIEYGTDPQDPDSDDDGIWDGRELELGKNPLLPDATVEYSVQVTLDPELYPSIRNPKGFEVCYDVDSRLEWDNFDYYASCEEVSIKNCRLDEEFVTCDLKIEFEPGVTYFLSVKAFDNLYESAFSNEMSFTLPADADFDGIPDKYEIVYGTDPYDPDSDNDGILDGQELGQGTDPLHNDLLAEYLVQVTVDLEAASIFYPARCEVLLSSIIWEVDIDACWFEEECMICDIKLELEPGKTYGISTRIFGDNNESVISNEIPFTLPIYFDY